MRVGLNSRWPMSVVTADPGTATIKVVALTAFAMKDDRERFVSAGFDGYLSKPISVRELPAQVREFLGVS